MPRFERARRLRERPGNIGEEGLRSMPATETTAEMARNRKRGRSCRALSWRPRELPYGEAKRSRWKTCNSIIRTLRGSISLQRMSIVECAAWMHYRADPAAVDEGTRDTRDLEISQSATRPDAPSRSINSSTGLRFYGENYCRVDCRVRRREI